MALILYIFLPLGWALTGRWLGWAVSLSVPTPGGKRIGGRLGRWCMGLFPAVYCGLFFLGGSGDAGHGVRLFGSEALFAVLGLPVWTVPVLGLYCLAAYVIGDLVHGLRSRTS